LLRDFLEHRGSPQMRVATLQRRFENHKTYHSL
jgi:hypothetical protein